MSEEHPDLPIYETVNLPPNLEAVKVEPEVFVTEEGFEVPVPKGVDTVKPPPKKPRTSTLMTYDEWKEASKEGELFLLADSPNPNQPRPQAAAIRYRDRPAGGISAEFVPDASVRHNPITAYSTLSLDPNVVPDSAFDDTVEVTGTYTIES